MGKPAKKTLAEVLGTAKGQYLEALLLAKGNSPRLTLDTPERVRSFLRASLCGSYLFARFLVPTYAAAVFSGLGMFPPADDRLGTLLATLVGAITGELCTNNVFERPGECHAHYRDLLEAFAAAGGDMDAVQAFEADVANAGFQQAVETSPLWSPGSRLFAENLHACLHDPLAVCILMSANEVTFAPLVYKNALASLPHEERFAKLRRFLTCHVAFDEGNHGPATLAWLELVLEKTGRRPTPMDAATDLVIALFAGERRPKAFAHDIS